MDAEEPCFARRLSALYAGDTLVAAHFGMRSPAVWYWWFPVDSHTHQTYSPGSLLLLRVAEAAGAQGHQLLDLGKSDERYKLSFADCETPVVEGLITRPTLSDACAHHEKAHWLLATHLDVGAASATAAAPLSALRRRSRSLPCIFGDRRGAQLLCLN